MIKTKILLFLLLQIFIFSMAEAGIMIKVPDKVAKGDAFVAQAVSDEPVKNFMFFWHGKTYNVRAMPDSSNGSTGEIILPVPLDEKAKKLSLGVGDGAKAIADVRADINIYEKSRPVQKLVVDKKYVNPPQDVKERIQKDREKVRAVVAQYLPERKWTLPLLRPVPGSVSSQFGMKRVFNGEPRSVHRGLDLRGASGTPIKACADGEVVLVDNLYFSGNTVYINHGEGVISAYLHMSEPKVQVGQSVKKGDVVGLVGATGRVTGPHLHLSLLAQGQSVDPQPFLETEMKKGKNNAGAR